MLEKIRMLNGTDIFGFKDDEISKEIKINGIYEKDLYFVLQKFLEINKNAVCLDVGANIGNHTLTMGQYAKKVYAFEPVPEIFEVLSKNINENKLNKKVKLCNFGLSNNDQILEIAIERSGNIGRSGIVNSGVQSRDSKYEIQQIQVKTGDETVQKYSINRVDFIKMDIEGHETEAILGLKETIQKFRPVMCIEWNCDKVRDGFKNHDIFNNILKGYECKAISYDNKFGQILRSSYLTRLLYFGFPKFLRCKIYPMKVILNDFDRSKNYGCVLMFPKEKESEVMNSLV
jgi:FkbM family methyltransferase